MDRWNKIIQKKIDKIKDNSNFKIIKDDDSKYIIILPINGGHYKNQTHILSIDLKCGKPEECPDKWFPSYAPKTQFITKIFHTNISPITGYICLDVLYEKWSPMNNIDTLVQTIILLLDDPAPTGNHLNADAAKLQQTCQYNFNQKSKTLKILHGKEYDDLYNECFAQYDYMCAEFYKNNEEILKKYI
jgi:ubiquitin-protein ligase